jgi:serine protease Do
MFSASLLVFVLACGVLIGTALTTGVNTARAAQSATDAKPLVIPPVNLLSNDFVKIAKMLEPSVVYITTESNTRQTSTTQRRRQTPQPEEGEEDEGLDLFRRFMDPFGAQPTPRFRREGSGSGFIVDPKGYIITNLHVVDDADVIKVRLHNDRTEYKAKIIGSDREIDIAVIKIDAGKSLPAVRIANSDGVQVGDWAVAIGAPFALEASVTAGIVSATGRNVGQQLQRFIQTDAAINPGNSGGPLVNINGEVIGVNTMIATRSGGYQGIGFALPINMVAKAYNSIVSLGRVARGSIGIRFDGNVKPETLRALGLKNGIIVSQVAEGGPAEKAGLRSDDVIIAINGKPIKDGDDLVDRISDTPIGQTITLTIDRDGKKMDKTLKVEERAEVFRNDPQFSRNRPEMVNPDTKSESSPRLGIGVRALTRQQREEMNFTEESGVIITTVDPGSFAEDIGLREKDIIVSINRKPVSSFEDVKAIVSGLKGGDAVAFRVMRPGPGSTRNRTVWFSTYISGELPRE